MRIEIEDQDGKVKYEVTGSSRELVVGLGFLLSRHLWNYRKAATNGDRVKSAVLQAADFFLDQETEEQMQMAYDMLMHSAREAK